MAVLVLAIQLPCVDAHIWPAQKMFPSVLEFAFLMFQGTSLILWPNSTWYIYNQKIYYPVFWARILITRLTTYLSRPTMCRFDGSHSWAKIEITSCQLWKRNMGLLVSKLINPSFGNGNSHRYILAWYLAESFCVMIRNHHVRAYLNLSIRIYNQLITCGEISIITIYYWTYDKNDIQIHHYLCSLHYKCAPSLHRKLPCPRRPHTKSEQLKITCIWWLKPRETIYK